jgi:hypothetical protein
MTDTRVQGGTLQGRPWMLVASEVTPAASDRGKAQDLLTRLAPQQVLMVKGPNRYRIMGPEDQLRHISRLLDVDPTTGSPTPIACSSHLQLPRHGRLASH